jgi:hypothetical protein
MGYVDIEETAKHMKFEETVEHNPKKIGQYLEYVTTFSIQIF